MPSSHYSHRPYRGDADLQSMLALLSTRPPQRVTDYPSAVDMQEIAGTPEGQASIQLWEDAGGALAGFTMLDGSSLAFEISSRVDFDDLAGQMLAWATQTLTATAASTHQPVELETSCRDDDRLKLAFLEQQGFMAQPVRTLHFRRSLSDPIAAPVLPDGFTIRPLAGEDEAAAWVELHRAAHGTETMTVEFRLAMMRAPDYAPELDLLAVAAHGRLAAYVMGHYSAEENRLRKLAVGYTDPVATHPDFQGKGLARALLLAAFARLKALGLDYAEVTTWGENTGMIRTAEAVGYRVYASTVFYNKPLSRRVG